MNNFISQLLKFQLDRYNKNNNVKINIKETSTYIEPLIIFVYNVNKPNEIFLNEIKKFEPKEYQKIKENLSSIDSKKTINSNKTSFEKEDLNQILKKNTHIYSSEISGLGKTEKIKNLINISKKEYIYFPLGGKLSRNIIFEKLEKILTKVEDVKKTAIHLDLYETEDISILNEFLFSFCFTKFYSNDKNILYIPINVEIYIEIPNCFLDFIKNYPILNYFEMDKISFNTKEELRLDENKKKFFNWMIPVKTSKQQQKPEDYINAHIGASTFSYHQINIFVKLFMHQYKIKGVKLTFLENEKDVTEECIQKFAECTKYFTLGVYAKLLTKTLDEENNKEQNKIKKDINNNNTDSNKNNFPCNINYDKIPEKENIVIDNINQNEKNDNTINNTLSLQEKTNMESNEEIGKNYEDLKKYYIKKLSDLYSSDLKDQEYKTPLIFISQNENKYFEILLSDEELKRYKSSTFLQKIKLIFQLENPVTKNPKNIYNSNLISLQEIIEKDNYVITSDNFRKMILISYRILAGIPVILMGETGCGKTGLIRKLYQLLNDGEDMDEEKNMVNVDSSISDEKLTEKMDKINNEAKNNKDKDFWVLFDEINTCNSLGLLNEIFINGSYNGTNIQKNIRLIGTCNPYRLKKDLEESSGLSHPNKDKSLAYDVNILPQSLMYFVFNFGFLQQKDEDKYIQSILSNHFKKFNPKLITIVKEIISKCHKYLRDSYGNSVVSLREIKRFLKLYDNLKKYYKNKDLSNLENTKNEKEKLKKKKKIKKVVTKLDDYYFNNEKIQIKSLIVAIYLSYYIRLIDQKKRTNFEAYIKENLGNLANFYLNSNDWKKNSDDKKKKMK